MGSLIRREAESELRTLTLYDDLHDGMCCVPIVDDKFVPHLKPRDWAVVDLTDLEPTHGEIYAVSLVSPADPMGRRIAFVVVRSKRRSAGTARTAGSRRWPAGSGGGYSGSRTREASACPSRSACDAG